MDTPRNSLGTDASSADRSGEHEFAVEQAGTCDHVLVPELLRAAGEWHSPEDFASRLDEPSYEPADRLVVRHGGRLVAHALLIHRGGWFGGSLLPVGGLVDLACLPEFRASGIERHLLETAQRRLRDQGAIVGLVRTRRTSLFREAGWSPASWQGWSQVAVTDLLAHLPPHARPRRRRRLKVRIWRRVELDRLMPVYRHGVRNQWGGVERSEPYWRWLCSRNAHTEIIVADHSKRRADQPDQSAAIVAFAVICGDQIVELVHRPGHELAGPLLLSRACQDAIERDHRTISLHTRASDPLHELLVTAGGTWQSPTSSHCELLMCKLFDARGWIEHLQPLLCRRATAAGITLPCEIGIHTGDQRYRLRLTDFASRLVPDARAAAEVVCQAEDFGPLLLGNADSRTLERQGKLVTRRRELSKTIRALFPPVVYWQSALDSMGAGAS